MLLAVVGLCDVAPVFDHLEGVPRREGLIPREGAVHDVHLEHTHPLTVNTSHMQSGVDYREGVVCVPCT